MTGVLSSYHRVPKKYIKLPTGGLMYQPGDIKLTDTNELPVYAMTALDEMTLKNPDALLNGEALIQLFKSCVPNVQNPSNLLAPDVEAIILAIFLSSSGDLITVEDKCPKCGTENTFEGSISGILDSIVQLDPPFTVDVNVGSEQEPRSVKIFVRPLNLKSICKQNLINFENNKMVSVLTSSSLSDEEKLKGFGECFDKTTKIRFDTLAECIEKITVQEGSSNDPEEIKNFLMQTDSSTIEKIQTLLNEINEGGMVKDIQVKCKNCEHEWSSSMSVNPTSFFSQSSKR